MGRSTSSCFKIITCGGDSADKDDLQLPPPPPEIKGSSDKRGWSFRKKSARHRVLSNTVISENLSSANKETPEPVDPNIPKTDTSTEKITVVECPDEKLQLSVSAEPKESESTVFDKDESGVNSEQLSVSAEPKGSESTVVDKDESGVNSEPEESVIIVIQTAIRGFLAQRELLKLKNVVKLQAAVRGHIERHHAVGTLRCVKAIVKMQALVRARHARLSKEGSSLDKDLEGKRDNTFPKTLDKEQSVTKTNPTYISIEKLLSNRFAYKLIESTPKNKPINLKCDPSKPNSTWNWLERWMSISSVEPTPKPELSSKQPEEEKIEKFVSPDEARCPAEDTREPADLASSTMETVLPSEGEENLITYEAENLKLEAVHPTLAAGDDNLELSHVQNAGIPDKKEASIISISVNQVEQSETSSEVVHSSVPRPEAEEEWSDQPKRSMKRMATEQLETEAKKCVFGSRKGSNPSFIAAQSKFEDSSSVSDPTRSTSQNGGVESGMDTISSGFETLTRKKEIDVVENLVPSLTVQFGGSECGTELSITSTLDSPDISDAGVANIEPEAKVTQQETYTANGAENLVMETKGASTEPTTNLSPVTHEPEKLEDATGESLTSTIAANCPHEELKPEKRVLDVQRGLDSETGGPTCRYSPEASPRSHVTIPESQGTPSSQVSVKVKKNRTEKSSSNQKRKSLSASKRSLSLSNHDTGARSSMEQLPKDQHIGKKRNSFGSPRPDQTGEEPRDSNSSYSLPHFMHATESARAKMNANNSPRSSPDVQDREYIKKRHSLPGANGRQGSPRIQRSMSQAQPGAKGTGSYLVHEKKWQR